MNESVMGANTSGSSTPDQGSYGLARKLFFVVSIVIFICLALFLLYWNGKSIYANGL